MQNMIFDSVFEVDSVLENKSDLFDSCRLHFEQKNLKESNRTMTHQRRRLTPPPNHHQFRNLGMFIISLPKRIV